MRILVVEALTDLVVLDNTDKLLSAKRLDQIKR
ncbi:hypothetical protein NIES37_27260 [Tolypothrix tenuis PCC 7101]|uniref:Uncharacterized protein n=1 Tax=Tolypothrix tenuis PCC 7101 TaxID=231146 RepID=A0A1Z4MZ84_9CYAN|nr:hypothetical protein NIES37_27260 [Tolypothrix tenuis PCC 7101]BAZ77308.1 hypothetical protein NIES50_59370 [Aulosira laxa NIES-50]